jgi:hypothetical protein
LREEIKVCGFERGVKLYLMRLPFPSSHQGSAQPLPTQFPLKIHFKIDFPNFGHQNPISTNNLPIINQLHQFAIE